MGRVQLAAMTVLAALSSAPAGMGLAAEPVRTTPAYAIAPKAADVAAAQEMGRRMSSAMMRISRVVGHRVTLDVPDMDLRAHKLFAEAAERTAQAFEDSTLVLNGREKTISITRVLFVEGERADAQLQGETLKITVAVRTGMAGPPPERIFHIIATQATA